ncbi:MAG: Trk system potassium transporter TrkA [Lachnospiraceae bacterium]|nr:Trk system potassium transporter TrkA [Lachnospiraceae bacterium]
MKIVIVGDGKLGNTLAKQLSGEGHDVVIIEKNAQLVENSMNLLDITGVAGNGATIQIQKEADVDKCDLFISVTASDELNLLSCMMARKLGAKHTAARVRNPEYTEQIAFMRQHFGISMVLNPEFMAASVISQNLRFPAADHLETFARGRAELIEIKVDEKSKLNGQKLSGLYRKYQVKVLVCAVQRGDEIIIPSGDFTIMAGDKINITASPSAISSFLRALGMYQDKIRSVMVVGGGRIGHYLCKMLSDAGMSVKLIEQNAEKCRRLSEDLPKVSVLNDDGTNHEILREEGIDNMDAFVSLTGIDEENIILSMYASSKGVRKVVTKINRTSLIKLLDDSILGTIVSPLLITSNQIVRYTRSVQNSVGNGVRTLHRIINNQVEALEFGITEKTDLVGVPLKELPTKDNLLVACIIRNNKVIIPDGNTTFEYGDSVIVVTTIPYLQDLKDIIKQ